MDINLKNKDFLYSAMREHGIPFPHNKSSCGAFIRWGRNCRYWLIAVFDGYKFGDFVTGSEIAAFPHRKYSKSEWSARQRAIAHAARETQKIQEEKWRAVADKANRIWMSAQPCREHDYLKKKKVPSIGLRVTHTRNGTINKYINDNIIYNNTDILVPPSALIIPIYSSDNNIASLQYICQSGNKRFLKGGRKQGCYFPLGCLRQRVCLAEGYATACSVFLAIGELTICCFDAGNLKPVAEKLRKFYPSMEIIICADNDSVGLSKAIEAGKAIDAVTVFPIFSYGYNLTDFNDLADLSGLETVKRQISRAFREK